MSRADDASLARRIATSTADAEAEHELCERFAPRIRLYGLRHLRDEHASHDLIQDVLALTLERLRSGRLRDPEMLASFVLGTCRLMVRNGRRTEQRRHELLGLYAAEQPVAIEGTAMAGGLAELGAPQDGRLAHCLGTLSERERNVIVLGYYAERDANQISEELGLSAGNVRVVRHRALARLLACMSPRSEASS